MSMPADGITAIMADSPLHLWVMNETAGGFTTFADQVGTKPLTKGSGVTPAGWGNIAGSREYGGPQTPAPSFDGTANAYATASGATLGGRALGWGIVMMMDSTLTSLTNLNLYCERGTSGNDFLRFYCAGNVLGLILCDDTFLNLKTATVPSTPNALRGGKGQYNAGGQFIGVSVSAAGVVDFYATGPFGVGHASAIMSPSHTWTNPGVNTYIGQDPLNPSTSFNGTLCWVAVFGSGFTSTQYANWYRALTPPPANTGTWSVSLSGKVCPKSDFWNTKLPDNAPLDPNSAAIINQWQTYNSANNFVPGLVPYVPMIDLDRTGRAPGGMRTAFAPTQDQHTFLASVPVPDTFYTADPYPANNGSDAISWVCQSSTGLQYDVYRGFTTNPPTSATQSSLMSPYILSFTPVTGVGTLAPGRYYYCTSATNANGESAGIAAYGNDYSTTLAGVGHIMLSVSADLTGTPAPTSWKVYRRGPYPAGGPFGTSADYGLLATPTFTAGTNVFIDDGSFTVNNSIHPFAVIPADTTHTYGQSGTAVTSDWASIGGGGSWDFLKNSAFNPLFKPSGAVNNGESASSCPAGAGVITLEEALAGLIPHPIAVAFPSGNQSVHVQGRQWPAPRHDGVASGTAAPTEEGMRLRFPHTFDENSLTYNANPATAKFQKAVVVAVRDYGLIIRDSAVSAMLMFAEETSSTGRNEWAIIGNGLSFGSPSISSLLDPIPWGQLQVIMPYRFPSRVDSLGRRTNRLDAPGNPTPVPY